MLAPMCRQILQAQNPTSLLDSSHQCLGYSPLVEACTRVGGGAVGVGDWLQKAEEEQQAGRQQ